MTKSMVWIVFLAGLGLVAVAVVVTVKRIQGGSGTLKLPGGIQVSWKGATVSFLVFGAAFTYGAVTWSIRIDERERSEVVQKAELTIDAMTKLSESEVSEYAPESLKAAKIAGQELAQALAATDGRFTLFRSYAAVLPVAERAAKAGDKLVADVSAGRAEARSSAERTLAIASAAVKEAAALLQAAPKGKGIQGQVPALQQELATAQSGLERVETAFALGKYREVSAMSQAVTSRATGIRTSVEAAKDAAKSRR
jgi:hypothetical protein